MSERISMPVEHRYGEGWLCGTMRGKAAFSDGHAMIVGTKRKSCQLPSGMLDQILDAAVAKRMPVAKVTSRKTEMGHGWEMRLLRLNGKVWIQQKYYDEVRRRFPRAKFYLGQKVAPRGSLRYVVAKDADGTYVAVVMPVRR